MIFFLKTGHTARREAAPWKGAVQWAVSTCPLSPRDLGVLKYLCVRAWVSCCGSGEGKSWFNRAATQLVCRAPDSSPLPLPAIAWTGLGLFFFPQLFILQPSLYCCFLMLSTSPFSEEEHSQPCCYRACWWHLPSTRAPTPGCRGC